MSGEERWKKVGMSESWRGKRSEEMTQSNTFSHKGRKYLLSPIGVMAIEVPQNEDIWREEWREKRNRFCHLSEKSE